MLDSKDGRFGKQESIYQQLWCLPKVEDQYVQVCTFTVGGHYGGSCLRSDPSLVIMGNSDMQPLRVLSDKDFLKNKNKIGTQNECRFIISLQNYLASLLSAGFSFAFNISAGIKLCCTFSMCGRLCAIPL